MIAVFTLLFLVGTLDLLHIVMPNSRGRNWQRMRLGVMVLLGVGAMIPVIILGDFITNAGVLIGFGVWSTTYLKKATPGWQLFAFSGLLAVTAWLLWPVIQLQLPNNAQGAAFSFPNPWSEYMWVLLAIAVLLINIGTANRIVRMVLDLVHSGPSHISAAPPAGRFIGALERILLVVLLLTGQGVSIAGIAAAKGIIRFPEISRTVREESAREETARDETAREENNELGVDSMAGGSASGKIPHHHTGLSAEIFFIGTITSWLIAFASVGLVVLAAKQ